MNCEVSVVKMRVVEVSMVGPCRQCGRHLSHQTAKVYVQENEVTRANKGKKSRQTTWNNVQENSKLKKKNIYEEKSKEKKWMETDFI